MKRKTSLMEVGLTRIYSDQHVLRGPRHRRHIGKTEWPRKSANGPARQPQPKPSCRNVSRRGAENAEKYQAERLFVIFSAPSAPLREKIFAGMRDSGVLHCINTRLFALLAPFRGYLDVFHPADSFVFTRIHPFPACPRLTGAIRRCLALFDHLASFLFFLKA
jgi:hypothetical protein